MLFKCQNCGAQFTADSSKVPNPKLKFKCVKCQTGYLVYVDTGEAPETRAAGAPSAAAPPVTRPTTGPSGPGQLRQVLTTVKELPSLPFIATKVMELTASPNTTMKQMEEVILRDSALAAKVLRYSNSALYGRAGQIASLTDALVLLGFSTVKTIVITSSVRSMHSTATHGYTAAGKTMWTHSVETAIASHLLASRKTRSLMEEAFVVGLLHDIGKTVIESRLPGMVRHIMNLNRESDETLEEIERKVLGIDHSELGAILCKKWNLPDVLEMGILYHHHPSLNKKLPILSHFAHLSDAISYHLALPPAKRAVNEAQLLETQSGQFLEINGKTLAAIVGETQETIERDKKRFDL